MIGPGRMQARGQLALKTETVTEIADADVFVKINGSFGDGAIRGFEITGNKLKWLGENGRCFLFTGTSDVLVNKACELTYALYRNGIKEEGAETPHTFPASARTSTIAITRIIKINKNDELDVWAKSSVVATSLSVKSLSVTLWG